MNNPVNGKMLPPWMLYFLAEERQTALTICLSNAGYYIGSLTEEGMPNFRASVEYFRTREMAEAALENGEWTIKNRP